MNRRLRFVSIVGARPQFIKAATLSPAIRARHDELILHTGQHYDPEMSDVFFNEMGIPRPDVDLECGSGTHAEQTAAMLVGIERFLATQQTDWVVTYGDTNSTLAGALAAAKLRIPVAHVEAGLRSFNRNMPEEINRVLVDHVSTALLCPSATAVSNLVDEGIRAGVHLVGDVMVEALAMTRPIAARRSRILETLGVGDRQFVLVTVHRAENTDSAVRLRGIVDAVNRLDHPVVFPVHPRTRKALDAIGYVPAQHVRVVPPAGYIDMVRLITSARLIMTDSGGLQKEAYWASVPCLTLREETEWVETVQTGWNIIVGARCDTIVSAARNSVQPAEHPDLYGGAAVSTRCVDVLEELATSTVGLR